MWKICKETGCEIYRVADVIAVDWSERMNLNDFCNLIYTNDVKNNGNVKVGISMIEESEIGNFEKDDCYDDFVLKSGLRMRAFLSKEYANATVVAVTCQDKDYIRVQVTPYDEEAAERATSNYTPKKPERINRKTMTAICPECKCKVIIDLDRDNYCYNCGTAIDWSKEDETN